MLHKDISAEELPRSIIDHPDLKTLLERLKSGRFGDRRRSIAVLADRRGLQIGPVCTALNLSRQSYRRYVRLFDEGGAEALFATRISPLRKFDNERVKKAVLSLLHQPPSNFDINRTTWKMPDLSLKMKERGEPAGEDVIRKIVKQAGYRWRKARIVLTSALRGHACRTQENLRSACEASRDRFHSPTAENGDRAFLIWGLQVQEKERGFRERPLYADQNFFREGRAGQWKSVLTSIQVDRIGSRRTDAALWLFAAGLKPERDFFTRPGGQTH
jgi:transposase